MQFNRVEEGGALEVLPKQNVDTGMGLERTAAVLNGFTTVYDLDVFQVIFREIESLCDKTYGSDEAIDRSMRIMADHVRSAVFAIGDGIAPSNVQQGYIIRRLIRRAIREGRRIGVTESLCDKVANVVIGEFGVHYRELETKRAEIIAELVKEEEKFGKTVANGMKELEKILEKGTMTSEQAFVLYSTYGFPLELTEEIVRERGGSVDHEAFKAEFEKHQELSRTASAGMFKGGLQDTSEASARLHTATHLLHAALRKVLGAHVQQKGSNITPERLRFDFSHPDKMTPEQIKQVEDMVNDVIKRDLPIVCTHMNVTSAEASGALGFFKEKYANLEGDLSVYQMGEDADWFSKEICGGPHANRTGELGSFKIQKEEASSAGVRRIKAVIG